MKRSKRLLAMFVVILVLVLATTSLAACGAKKMKVKDFADMFTNGVTKLASPDNGYYFNLDTKLSYLYEKDSKSTRYDLTLKGTLDTDPKNGSTDNQLFMELNQSVDGGAAKTLLGLYYDETECNSIDDYDATAPILYVNVLNAYKFSFNTYSVKKMVKDRNPSAVSDQVADPVVDVGGIIIGFLPTLFEETLVKDTVKTSTKKNIVTTTAQFDINKLLSFVFTLLADFVEDDVIEGYLEGMDANFTWADIKNLKIDAPIQLTMQYEKAKKGEFGKLLNAKIAIDIQRDHDINIALGDKVLISSEQNPDAILPIIGKIEKCKVTIGFDKLDIASGSKLNIPELAAIIAKGNEFKAINVANIAIDGKVKFKSSTNPNAAPIEYDLIIRADINPIPLAFLSPNWDTKDKVFQKMGKFYIGIRSADGSKSLIELAYDPIESQGSDYVFASVNIGANIIANLKMDASALEGLMNAIVNKVNPPKTEGASQADTMADGTISNIAPDLAGFINGLIVDGTVKAIMDMIDPKLWDKDIDGNTDTKDPIGGTITKVGALIEKLMSAENGAVQIGTVTRGEQENGYIELNFPKILDEVNNAFNLGDIVGTIKDLIGSLLGGDILNVEITTNMADVNAWYGACPSNFKAFAKFNGNNGRSKATTMAKVTGIKDMPISMTHDAFKANYVDKLGESITVVGKNLIGNDFTSPYNAYRLYLIDGYDSTKTGEQTIRIAVQDKNNGIDKILGALGGIIGGDLDLSKYPIGFEAFQVKIDFTA